MCTDKHLFNFRRYPDLLTLRLFLGEMLHQKVTDILMWQLIQNNFCSFLGKIRCLH